MVGTMTFTAALRELRTAQKTSKGVSLYSRHINRPLGRVLAAAAFRAGLTPNQVTLLSALVSYAALAAVALLPPSWGLAAGVYAGLVLGFALDSADGQLARLRRECVEAKEALSVDTATTVPVALPDLLTTVRVTRVELEQLAHRVQDLADGEVAVARTDEGGLDGVGLPGPHQAALLAQRAGLLDEHPRSEAGR